LVEIYPSCVSLRTELLKALEEERYEMLPEEIYLKKTHLKETSAACLRLKPAKVVEDYLGRFREWKRTRELSLITGAAASIPEHQLRSDRGTGAPAK